MSKRLLLLGSGGHFKSVLDTLDALGIYDDIGVIAKEKNSQMECDCNIIGTDDDLRNLYEAGWAEAFICVGSVGNTLIREKLYSKLTQIGFRLPIVVDPSAIVSPKATILNGVFIGKRAVVNSGAIINTCAIINTGAIIEHDCTIGMFTHVSPGAVICGDAHVGDYSHVGAGSTIKQQIRIGTRTMIGMGSVVVSDIPDGKTAFGCPCRIIEQ